MSPQKPLDGEIVQDDAIEIILTRIQESGIVHPDELKMMLRRQLHEVPNISLKRMAFAALGAAIGSLYRGVGAGVGGAAGAVIHDSLVEKRQKRRRKKNSPLLLEGEIVSDMDHEGQR